jgi:hypothetical protein
VEGLIWPLVFAGFFYFMVRFGCGAHMAHGGQAEDVMPALVITVFPVTQVEKIARLLLKRGINAISLNSDRVVCAVRHIAETENRRSTPSLRAA